MVKSDVCFLVGAERSGTTLLRLALNSHSQIAWTREFEYAVDRVAADGSYPDLTAYVEWLATHRIFQSSGYRIREGFAYPALVRDFLEQQRAVEGKPIAGATVHRHFDRCLQIWPNARFIHLVRDPRDVARSAMGMGWAGNEWKGVEGWLEAEEMWERMRSLVPPHRRIDLRYESFARRPEKELRRVCRFLDVSYEPGMLEFDRRSSYRRPDPALVEQWRTRASEREIAWVETRAGKRMAALGYVRSKPVAKAPGPLQCGALSIHDYWKRIRFRMRRNGVGLFLEDWMARRFGARAWQDALRLRINAIEAEHLQ
jgi:hypothetical protein